jgi:hypothetical protein
MNVTLVVFLAVLAVILLWKNMTMTFKIGYYEQTLENNKDKFSEERYKQIEAVKAKKSPF